MNVTEIFKDSLIYPTKDLNKLVILGSLITIVAILAILTVFSFITMSFSLPTVLGIITLISALIVGFIYNGYSLSIINETIENKQMVENINSFPDFNWSNNIVDGIKVWVLDIIYMIIPVIVTAIFAYVLLSFMPAPIGDLNITQLSTSLLSNPNSLEYSAQLNTLMIGVQGLFTILSLVFTLFAKIAKVRLAETSRLSSIFEFEEIYNSIAKIGWGDYIVWFILLIVISSIIGVIMGIIFIIPIIGPIVFFLLFVPFMLIFESRATGLIYNESKIEHYAN
ncbi:MAG: DUF4013 domain-containing protein [Methanobrevibacter sp.]|nr:DUF4013 domain-containing protein [Methanobrevibacter sp.]